jgi:hypothetical protein
MRTPAGQECPHYYEDFNRGREIQECRLVRANPETAQWRPKDCERCPVPEIVRANASPHMRLTLTIRPSLMGFVRRMEVQAWCDKHDIAIDDPYVGCPLCAEDNPGLQLFKQALEDPDD